MRWGKKLGQVPNLFRDGTRKTVNRREIVKISSKHAHTRACYVLNHAVRGCNTMANRPDWPPLPLAAWRDTRDTLQMWTQVAGKIALALTPPVNHFWNVALQIGPRGLSTKALAFGERA